MNLSGVNEKSRSFFGTFNPFHNGHSFMVNHCLNECDIDEVWIVVSPQNPLKKNLEILDIYERIKIIDKSISNEKKIKFVSTS